MFWIDFRRDVADMTLEWVNKHAEHEFNVYLGRDPSLEKIKGGGQIIPKNLQKCLAECPTIFSDIILATNASK